MHDPAERTLHHHFFDCGSPELAREWKNKVINAAYGGDISDGVNLVEKKKLLALLNPFGGMGLAPRKYEKAREIFDLAHIDITLK